MANLFVAPACGCRINAFGMIAYCPRHAAADEMYEALKRLYIACDVADIHGELSELVDGILLDGAKAALALAEGDDDG